MQHLWPHLDFYKVTAFNAPAVVRQRAVSVCRLSLAQRCNDRAATASTLHLEEALNHSNNANTRQLNFLEKHLKSTSNGMRDAVQCERTQFTGAESS